MLFWRFLVIHEMIKDYPPDSPYVFLETPPSHTQNAKNFHMLAGCTQEKNLAE